MRSKSGALRSRLIEGSGWSTCIIPPRSAEVLSIDALIVHAYHDDVRSRVVLGMVDRDELH
jgi:hypothetical protein